MIIRAERPDSNFYILDKKISEDKKLSWGARGLLVFLLGKPDNWQVSTQNLINETLGSGKPTARDGVRSLVNELIEAGYIKRYQRKGESGKIEGVNYLVSEAANPETPKPETANPATVHPATANPPLIRTETPTSNETSSITEKTVKPAKNSRPILKDLQEFDRLIDLGVDGQIAKDFLAIRKAKRAPLTETALKGINKEAEKAGWTLNEALSECLARGWQSFKADWVNKPQQKAYVSEKEKSQAAARATFAAAGIHGMDFNDNERVIHDYVEQPKLQVIHNA